MEIEEIESLLSKISKDEFLPGDVVSPDDYRFLEKAPAIVRFLLREREAIFNLAEKYQSDRYSSDTAIEFENFIAEARRIMEERT